MLYDISEVCRLVGTTSRTLRFYEEKGIIQSTTVGISERRKYTKVQLSHIRNVLVLRSLGLSVKSIHALLLENADLRETILSKKAEIYALIEDRSREISLLNEALFAIDAGRDIFADGWNSSDEKQTEEMKLALLCSEAIINDDTKTLYSYFGDRLSKYLPEDAFSEIKKDTFSSLGQFISFDRIDSDRTFPNKIYTYYKFSRLGLRITTVFYSKKLEGLWLGYYETLGRSDI